MFQLFQSQCRSLIGLDLSNNSLGDDGVLILKEGLLQCKTLKYLNLSNTSITSEGVFNKLCLFFKSHLNCFLLIRF